MSDQEPELDELREIVAGLELIQRISQDGRGHDVVSNEALDAAAIIADSLLEIVRSLDETNMFDLSKVDFKNNENAGA